MGYPFSRFVAQFETLFATQVATQFASLITIISMFTLPALAEEYRVYFERGRYQGMEVDTSSRRSVVTIGRQGDVHTVEHFSHQNRFWRAEIPVNGIEDVIGQGFNFSSGGNLPVNHVQARFKMKSTHPIMLTAMDGSGDTATISDFVSTVEGVGPVGIVWNTWDAVVGNLVNAHRLVSIEQIVVDRIINEHYEMPQYLVSPLSDEEKRDGLIRILRDADEAQMKQAYYLFLPRRRSKNCTSTKFDVLDATVRYKYFHQRVAALLLNDLPLSPVVYLRLRGRLGNKLQSLNEEFAPLIMAGHFGDEAKVKYLEHFNEDGTKKPVSKPPSCPWELWAEARR